MSTTTEQIARLLTVADFATYCGFQPGNETIPGFELWNLTQPIPGHPIGSTVARQTIERHLARIRAADEIAEARGEGRTLRAGRVNPHD